MISGDDGEIDKLVPLTLEQCRENYDGLSEECHNAVCIRICRSRCSSSHLLKKSLVYGGVSITYMFVIVLVSLTILNAAEVLAFVSRTPMPTAIYRGQHPSFISVDYGKQRHCTLSLKAGRKSTASPPLTHKPQKIAPLTRSSKPIKKRSRGNHPNGDAFESDALLSRIAAVTPSDPAYAYSTSMARPKGRPESVPGAMNKSTMMSNLDAAAAADALVASGSVPLSSKSILIEIAQEEKKKNDRKKYYDTVTDENVDGGTLPNPFFKEVQEVEQLWSSTSTQGKARISSSTSQSTKKRGRGRPRKNQNPNGDNTTLSTATDAKYATTLSESSQAKTTTLKRKKRSRVKQIRKRDPQLKRGKLRGDKLSLQKYYNTELLTTHEEYSLGMQVQFLMKCEEVYDGLTTHLMRNPTIGEWAHACGFEEPDKFSEDDYVESRFESSIRPLAYTVSDSNLPDDSDKGSDNSVKVGILFKGTGLEKESGVGRGRGRVKKPPPIKLAKFTDDSLLKFTKLEDDEDEELVLQLAKSIKVNKDGKKVLIPINRGAPSEFVDMMLTSKEAKQRMVECNMRLVVSIARRYHNVGVNIQDLVQEGSLGLYRAAEKFDPSKGFKFSTYASWWIQQAVFRSIAYHSRTIRLPVHVHNLLNRVRRVRTSLQQDLGRAPSNEEIAEQLDMTPEKYNKMIHLTKSTISLEKPKYTNNPKDLGHESDASLGDTIDSSATIRDDNTPEQTVDEGLFQDDLKEMLQILGEDERRVISARYGLNDGLTRTVTAVAIQLRQTKSWVRSQECRALRKLRRPWYEKRLKEHQNSLTGR